MRFCETNPNCPAAELGASGCSQGEYGWTFENTIRVRFPPVNAVLGANYFDGIRAGV
jgi:hypothetical protein